MHYVQELVCEVRNVAPLHKRKERKYKGVYNEKKALNRVILAHHNW